MEHPDDNPNPDERDALTAESLDLDEERLCPRWTRRRARASLIGFVAAEAGLFCRKRARDEIEGAGTTPYVAETERQP